MGETGSLTRQAADALRAARAFFAERDMAYDPYYTLTPAQVDNVSRLAGLLLTRDKHIAELEAELATERARLKEAIELIRDGTIPAKRLSWRARQEAFLSAIDEARERNNED